MVWCGVVWYICSGGREGGREGGRPGLLCHGGRFRQLNFQLLFGTIIHVRDNTGTHPSLLCCLRSRVILHDCLRHPWYHTVPVCLFTPTIIPNPSFSSLFPFFFHFFMFLTSRFNLFANTQVTCSLWLSPLSLSLVTTPQYRFWKCGGRQLLVDSSGIWNQGGLNICNARHWGARHFPPSASGTKLTRSCGTSR